jgi:hypothetical protein
MLESPDGKANSTAPHKATGFKRNRESANVLDDFAGGVVA